MEQGFIHKQTLFAEPIFDIGNFEVTNSLLNGWVSILFIAMAVFILRRKISLIPGKLQSFFEMFVDGFMDMVDGVTGNRQRTLALFPFTFSLFVFILVNNYMGLLPGIGTVGKIIREENENIFIPFFRGATADLNTTLALALIAVITSHVLGVFKLGIWTHLNKFVNIKAFLEIPKEVVKSPSNALAKVIEIFSGLVEIVGEVAKVASLSLRLFGNIFAGEILIFSMASLVAYFIPIPFIFLELLVGVIQALVFSMLTLVFISVNTAEHGH